MRERERAENLRKLTTDVTEHRGSRKTGTYSGYRPQQHNELIGRGPAMAAIDAQSSDRVQQP